MGDLGEALVLVAFAALSIQITVVQESRTKRALEALRDLTSLPALVTRRASAIETLGSATVLCTDKTGTLTHNRMQIAELALILLERLKPLWRRRLSG